MGIVNPYMSRTYGYLADGVSGELIADPEQSFLVKDIIVGEPTSEWLDVTIDKSLVGRFRLNKELGSHLAPYIGNLGATASAVGTCRRPNQTILSYLAEKGHFKGFPIAEGQKMILSPTSESTKLKRAVIIYEEYEGGDINSEDENGSDSTEYLIINYGDTGGSITVKGDFPINVMNSPTEFPAFPIGKVVPAKTEIDLIGILGSEAFQYPDVNDGVWTSYLKLMADRTVLFDDERNGLVFRGSSKVTQTTPLYYGNGMSVIGNLSTIDPKEPFMLAKPITFEAGEELNVSIIAEQGVDGGTIPQDGTEIGFIMKIRRVA